MIFVCTPIFIELLQALCMAAFLVEREREREREREEQWEFPVLWDMVSITAVRISSRCTALGYGQYTSSDNFL